MSLFIVYVCLAFMLEKNVLFEFTNYASKHCDFIPNNLSKEAILWNHFIWNTSLKV